jgi:hypothetical protein
MADDDVAAALRIKIKIIKQQLSLFVRAHTRQKCFN